MQRTSVNKPFNTSCLCCAKIMRSIQLWSDYGKNKTRNRVDLISNAALHLCSVLATAEE